MSDLISRSALLSQIGVELTRLETDNDRLWEMNRKYHAGMAIANGIIIKAPAVDAEVVRHGRWIEVVTYDQDGDCLEVEYKCSECGRLEGLDDEPYCNCGAKMDAEVEG